MARNKKAKFENPTKLADITMAVSGLPDLDLSEVKPTDAPILEQKAATATKVNKRNRPKQIEQGEGVHFLVTPSQLSYLDQMVLQARSNNGNKKLKRPAILRACIELMREAGVDITGVQTEDEIKTRIRNAVKKSR